MVHQHIFRALQLCAELVYRWPIARIQPAVPVRSINEACKSSCLARSIFTIPGILK